MGIYIGTLDSETYLPSLIYQLFSIFDDKYYRKEVDDKNATNILHLDDFLLTLEETFDDFIKRIVRGEKKYIGVWFYLKIIFLNMKMQSRKLNISKRFILMNIYVIAMHSLIF